MGSEPGVARQGDLTICPLTKGNTPHIGGKIVGGLESVTVNSRPIARKGDKVRCACGDTHKIAEGVETVTAGGQPIAFDGCSVEGGGKIITASSNTVIGFSDEQAAAYEGLQEPIVEVNTIADAIGGVGSKNPKTVMSEAMGELGLAEFKKLYGMSNHPDFKIRYHGPDALVEFNTSEGPMLFGLEAKGGKDSVVALNKHQDGNRQQSRKANLKRAKQMQKKKEQGKVGAPSKSNGSSLNNVVSKSHQSNFPYAGTNKS